MAKITSKWEELVTFKRWQAGMKKKLPELMRQEIIDESLAKGKSPVDGGKRFQKYSDSYIDQIKKRAAFFTSKNGKVIAINKLTAKELKAYRASTDARRQNRSNDEFIDKMWKKKFGGLDKKISPVNIKLTGKLWNSLRFVIRGTSLVISFTDKKAPWHDNGEGKMPQRKLLPTRQGEQFTRSIRLRILEISELIYKLVSK